VESISTFRGWSTSIYWRSRNIKHMWTYDLAKFRVIN